MRAITLHQPYASLVALGVKRIETRSWRTAYRGRIAIHAAALDTDRFMHRHRAAWDAIPHGDPLPRGAVVATAELVDCVPIVDDMEICRAPYLRVFPSGKLGLRLADIRDGGGLPTDVTDQLPFGVFEPGRWAWLLDEIAPTTERCPACWGARFPDLPPLPDRPEWVHEQTCEPCELCEGRGVCDPVPARGHQGLWNWEPA